MGRAENLSVGNTSMRDISQQHKGLSCRLLWHTVERDWFSGPEKRTFLCSRRNWVTVSCKIFSIHCSPTLEDKSFSRLRALNTWLTSSCFSSWIKFIDKLLLEPWGQFPNCWGSHKRHWIQTAQHQPVSCPQKQEHDDRHQGNSTNRGTAFISLSLNDESLLHITQGKRRISVVGKLVTDYALFP